MSNANYFPNKVWKEFSLSIIIYEKSKKIPEEINTLIPSLESWKIAGILFCFLLSFHENFNLNLLQLIHSIESWILLYVR